MAMHLPGLEASEGLWWALAPGLGFSAHKLLSQKGPCPFVRLEVYLPAMIGRMTLN